MEVDSPVRDAMKIRESAGGRSNGGSGVIINGNTMQVFISVASDHYNTHGLWYLCWTVGISCRTMASKSSPVCTIDVLSMSFEQFFLQYSLR